MDVIKRYYEKVQESCFAVVECRSSASAPYLMFINTIFWLSAFYLEREIQFRVLLSLAVGIFSWDILLYPSYEHSIIIHILLWPIQNFFRALGVTLAFLSAYSLKVDTEKACWLAYGSVVCILVNPMWRYQQFNRKIGNILYKLCVTLKNFGHRFIILPSIAIYNIASYIFLLKWLPVLFSFIQNIIRKTGDFLSNIWKNFILSIKNLCILIKCKVKNALIHLKQFIICIAISIKNYIIHKLRSCKEWIFGKLAQVRDWICDKFIRPIRNALLSIFQFLRYYLCGHWWPGLKAYLVDHIGRPVKRLFNYICFATVYIFCGYWVTPLFKLIIRYLQRFRKFIFRTCIAPIVRYMKYLLSQALIAIRRVLHQLGLIVRDSILWPFCVILFEFLKAVGLIFHAIIIQPCCNYFYTKYKKCEDCLLIYVLGPVCKIIVDSIPEKSPFCDDTDTELAELLPIREDNISETENLSEKQSVESRSSISVTEDEHDFVRGLKFPSLITSESSDENLEAFKPLKKKHKRKRPSKTECLKSVPKDPTPSVIADGKSDTSSENSRSSTTFSLNSGNNHRDLDELVDS